MRHPTTNRLLTAALAAGIVSAADAQQFTTVLTHGFTTGAKGLWVQGMAEAILARAGEGTVYRYDPGDGRWQLVSSLNEPDDVVVLIFNWTAESDGPAVGPNWNYVQAAADALHASLRHPRYTGGSGPADVLTGRTLHLIGHSRGACVMSETARRLALAGIPVDQVTTLDPHPVDGT
ncbi:MAG: alpha/beta hydrolase family protein, partial [Planctomycetota bacterium]